METNDYSTYKNLIVSQKLPINYSNWSAIFYIWFGLDQSVSLVLWNVYKHFTIMAEKNIFIHKRFPGLIFGWPGCVIIQNRPFRQGRMGTVFPYGHMGTPTEYY